MELSLQLKETDKLTIEEKIQIDKFIENIIVQHKQNGCEINRLVVDSVTALTVSKARAQELSEQGFFKRAWGSLTGKNQKLRADADRNFARAQYASQQTLQKLAEQNLMTFDLITAINNKLNTLSIETDEEINKIYNALIVFFKQTRSDMIQINSRLDKLEKNVNLLNWNATIEYQMYEGVDYCDLSDIEKIVCISNDFFHLTKGEWNISDLMLLKSTLSELGLPVKSTISSKDFFKYLIEKPACIDRLFKDIPLDGFYGIEVYEAPLIKGIEKAAKLQAEEKYILDTVTSQLQLAGVGYNEREIQISMLQNYLMSAALTRIDVKVNMFDFIVELLANLKLVNNLQNDNPAYNETEAAAIDILDNSSVKAEELLYEEAALNHIGNSAGNITNGGLAAVQGDWIFYKNYKDAYKLYKVRTDGTEKTRLNNDDSMYINVIGNWVYYLRSFNKNIYRIKLDGTEEQKLNEEPSKYVTVVGDWIYYINEKDGKIYKLKTNGSEKIKLTNDNSVLMNVTEEWIFYYHLISTDTISNASKYGLYRINLNGLDRMRIRTYNAYVFRRRMVLGMASDNNLICRLEDSQLLIMNSNGGNERKLTLPTMGIFYETISSFNVENGNCFISTCNSEYTVERDYIKLFESSKKTHIIQSTNFPKTIRVSNPGDFKSEYKNINIIKDWIFFERNNRLYRCSKVDGSGLIDFD